MVAVQREAERQLSAAAGLRERTNRPSDDVPAPPPAEAHHDDATVRLEPDTVALPRETD